MGARLFDNGTERVVTAEISLEEAEKTLVELTAAIHKAKLSALKQKLADYVSVIKGIPSYSLFQGVEGIREGWAPGIDPIFSQEDIEKLRVKREEVLTYPGWLAQLDINRHVQPSIVDLSLDTVSAYLHCINTMDLKVLIAAEFGDDAAMDKVEEYCNEVVIKREDGTYIDIRTTRAALEYCVSLALLLHEQRDNEGD